MLFVGYLFGMPPCKNAGLWKKGHPRNEAVLVMRKEGLAYRKKISGYHSRSLAQTAMSRFKQLMAGKITLRTYNGQVREPDGTCQCDKQTERPWSAGKSATNVTVTWNGESCALMSDLGNHLPFNRLVRTPLTRIFTLSRFTLSREEWDWSLSNAVRLIRSAANRRWHTQ